MDIHQQNLTTELKFFLFQNTKTIIKLYISFPRNL